MLGVASRFAVLKIEGEDGPRNPGKKSSEKAKGDDKKLQGQVKQQAKKKGGQTGQNGQKSTTTKGKGKGSQNARKKVPDAQWEEWKKKDEQYVDTNYEDELQEAILQSKLDYEEKKDIYDQSKKEMEADKKLAGKKTNKKSKTMSLDQFNSMQSETNGSEEPECTDENDVRVVDDPEFFERIREEAKQAVKEEQNKKLIKEREPFVDEMITIAQYQARLEERDQEIASLKEENEKLKEDMAKIKSRNKKLFSILGQAEMRDKAEILVQVDKLQHVRDELTVEVANLHALLEQERSKVRSLTASDSKGKGGKKRTASETNNAN